MPFGFTAQGYLVAFLYGPRTFEKTDFAKMVLLEKYDHFLQVNPVFRSFGEKFTFAKASAVQTKHGTKKVLNKKCCGEYGLLAKHTRSFKKGRLT